MHRILVCTCVRSILACIWTVMGAPASKKKTRVDFFDKAKLTYLIRNVSKYSNITSPGCLTPKFYAFEMMLDI